MRILVLADDLTGAAEIAGIGWRFGLPTRLQREPLADAFEGLTVVDTDSRSLAPAEASAAVRRFLAAAAPDEFGLIYKKIDSVLRGPVMAEVDAMARALSRNSALLLPQNPSRGRTIAGGIYRIDGVPLELTSFRNDPEYPARTSDVLEHLGPSRMPITIANAASIEEVRGWARNVSPLSLPGGGADFFTAILESRGLVATQPRWNGVLRPPILMVCGSVSAYSKEVAERARREGIGIFPIPSRPEEWDDWIGAIGYSLKSNGRALMTTSPAPQSEVPKLITHSFATGVHDVIVLADPAAVLIEGGATASAVCRASKWHRLDIEGELVTGVVAMRVRHATGSGGGNLSDAASTGPLVIVKPGSYPWPESVWR